MRRAIVLAVTLLSIVAGARPEANARTFRIVSDAGGNDPYVVPGQFLVGFKSGVTAAKQVSILSGISATTKLTLTPIRARLVTIAAAKVPRTLAALRRNSKVRYAEPNFVIRPSDLAAGTPNDPMFRDLWGLQNTGQTVNGTTGLAGADSDVTPAWSRTTGRGVVVAVIDSGVDFSHPDLGGSADTSPLMWVDPGENCGSTDPTIPCAQRTNGNDDDNDGHVDDWHGWDFPHGDNNPMDDVGHGTHVSGTIAATPDNGVGVVGVAPGVRIMGLKFITPTGESVPGLPAASGTTADAVASVLYAVAHGAKIINASWGSRYFSQALYDALAQADSRGVLVVAAAGNWGLGPVTSSPAEYPAAFELPNIISVAAHDSRNRLPEFTFWGDLVDLAAPGVNVLSTWPAALASSCSGTAYCYLDGTSMAAPHVVGAAALLMERFPALSPAKIKSIILGEVRPLADTPMSFNGSSWSENTKSRGALDAGRAVACSRSLKRSIELWVDRPAKGFIAIVNHRTAVTAVAETCPPGASVVLKATANGIPFLFTDRGDGTYVGAFTPTAVGPVRIEVDAASPSGSASTAAVDGRASRGYTMSDDRYQWVDAAAVGSDTRLHSALDGTTVQLPFPFKFYGQSFNTLTIVGKGWLTFGDPVAPPGPDWWPIPHYLSNAYFPNPDPPTGVVAPFWAELSLAVSGGVWYAAVGTPPHRRFVVAWTRRGKPANGRVRGNDGVSIYSEGTLCPGRGNFEVIFDETTNLIRFEYQHVAFGCHPYGGDALIGIENFAGDVGSQFSAFGYDPQVGESYQPVLKPYEGKKGVLFTP